MAKQSNTQIRDRGDGDEALSTVTITAADGTIIHAGAFSGYQPPVETDGTEPTAEEGETVGIATGELYDAALTSSPPGDSNGNGGT